MIESTEGDSNMRKVNKHLLETFNCFNAGIFVREVSKEELAEIISGLHIVVEKGTDGSEMKVINHPNRAFKQRVKELLRMYGESNNDNIHEINAALDHLKRMICP